MINFNIVNHTHQKWPKTLKKSIWEKWLRYGKSTYSHTGFYAPLRVKYTLCTGGFWGTYPVRTRYVLIRTRYVLLVYHGKSPKINNKSSKNNCGNLWICSGEYMSINDLGFCDKTFIKKAVAWYAPCKFQDQSCQSARFFWANLNCSWFAIMCIGFCFGEPSVRLVFWNKFSGSRMGNYPWHQIQHGSGPLQWKSLEWNEISDVSCTVATISIMLWFSHCHDPHRCQCQSTTEHRSVKSEWGIPFSTLPPAGGRYCPSNRQKRSSCMLGHTSPIQVHWTERNCPSEDQR